MNTTFPRGHETDELETPATPGIEQHREYLLGYALSRLQERDRAEDAVQETFLAAISAQKTFTGNSSKRTWLTGILNHKVADQMRHTCRHRALFSSTVSDEGYESDEAPAQPSPVNSWSRDPRMQLEQKEMLHAFQEGLQRLPERLATVFSAYETEDRSGQEICAALDISENNLWTILHRARKQLREHLSTSWIMNS